MFASNVVCRELEPQWGLAVGVRYKWQTVSIWPQHNYDAPVAEQERVQYARN